MDIGKGSYTVLKPGGPSGSRHHGQSARGAGAPTAWTVYVTVDDVDSRVARVANAGGAVIVPPVDIPTVGRVAVIQDPTGGATSFGARSRPSLATDH